MLCSKLNSTKVFICETNEDVYDYGLSILIGRVAVESW